jgi:rhodanese-related sulfurtransferase
MMTQRTPFQCIGALEAEALTRRDGVLVLDVRDAKAYGRSHIKGAEHVSISNLSAYVERTPKSRPVLIYCYHGHASKEYAKVFSDFGFSEVYSMDGGYEAWSRRPRFKGAVLDAPAVSSPIG